MKIAVFCPNWVGDAVMATPALRALRHTYRNAWIIGVMRPVIADVLEGLPYFDARVLWQPKSAVAHCRTLRAWRVLRSMKPDIALLLTNSCRSALLAAAAGIRRRIGYARDGRSWLLTERLYAPRQHGRWVPIPQVEYYLRLTDRLGCRRHGLRLELRTTARDEADADEVWRRERLAGCGKVIVFNPGSAFGPAKRWPERYFAELARLFVKRHGARVLVLCGPNEQQLAQAIVRGAAHPAVRSLAGYTPRIGLSKACVRRASLMITTDSGPRHFAAAFDVPVVTLFGPTHIQWTETFYEKALHLQRDVPCGPCQLRVCPLDHRCMTELEPEAVFKLASRFWQQHLRKLPLRATA